MDKTTPDKRLVEQRQGKASTVLFCRRQTMAVWAKVFERRAEDLALRLDRKVCQARQVPGNPTFLSS